MRPDSAHLEHARKVADAILYEGYLLYPYRGSAQKNRARFQFGVLVPPAYAAVDDCELSASQTECLVECPDDAEVQVLVRFLQLQPRTVRARSDGGGWREVSALEVDGTAYTAWDEALERQEQADASVAALLDGDVSREFHVGSAEVGEDITDASGGTAGRLIRRWDPLDGVIRLHAARMPGPYGALRLRVRVENHTAPQVAPRTRDDALRHSLIAAHVLIGVPGGTFLSQTDPRAAELMDRLDSLPPEMLERMHGAIRYLKSVPGAAPPGPGQDDRLPDELADLARPEVPWWDPGADTTVSPETDHVVIGGVEVARGSRVRMRPGSRRTDAQDLFLAGRTAMVEAVLHDVDGQVHVAVSPDHDPLAELQRSHGRFLYFAPDEIEPVDPDPERRET